MARCGRISRLVIAGALLTAGLVQAQSVPPTVTFTARLADDGTPVQGSKVFLFKLFPTLAGGSEAWSESQTLTVTNGDVSAELGASTALTDTLFAGPKMYLEVAVDGVVLAPRTAVVSVPYALRAGVSGKVGTISEADIQKRVSASGCPVGTAIRVIAADGTVTCQSASVTPTADGGTAINSVLPGVGLTGGGSSGDVTLSVVFAGSGAATNVSRSDHAHSGTYLPIGTTLACNGTDKVSAIGSNGSVACQPDLVGSGTVTNVSGTGPISVANQSTTPSISMTQASASANGWLSSADFSTFAGKGNGTVTNVTGTPPVTVTSGSTTATISMAAATTSVNGYLTATDWNTFNNKAPASGSPNYAPNTGSTNYVQNQPATTQTGWVNITEVGAGMNPAYPLDVAANGTTVMARFGNAVTIGPGNTIGFNEIWNNGFAYAASTGHAASFGFDPSNGRLMLNHSAGSVTGGAAHGVTSFLIIDSSGRTGLKIPYPFTLNYPFQVGSDTSDGNGAYLSATGTWTNVSTRTKKTKIRPVNDALALLEQVRVYRYRYRTPGGGDDGRDHLGVIAEELPDVVATPDRKGAPTGELIGLALGASRELAAKVAALEAENARQAAQIEKLMRRLDALEKR